MRAIQNVHTHHPHRIVASETAIRRRMNRTITYDTKIVKIWGKIEKFRRDLKFKSFKLAINQEQRAKLISYQRER